MFTTYTNHEYTTTMHLEQKAFELRNEFKAGSLFSGTTDMVKGIAHYVQSLILKHTAMPLRTSSDCVKC